MYDPPIVFDADRVAVIQWRGSDWNTVLITFDYGATLQLSTRDLGLDLAGRLANPEQAEWCVNRVCRAVWPDL